MSRIAKCLLLCSIVGQVSVRAQEFCALTVDLQTFDGRPASRTPVTLVDSSGKVVFHDSVAGPRVQICDFGFGPHTLVVGSCYKTEISKVVLRLGQPIHLAVRKSECPAEVSRTTCLVYFRIRDQSGAAVAEVELNWETREGPKGSSDAFGRVESFLPEDATGVAILSKTGYDAQRIGLQCADLGDIEREVVMKQVGR